MNQRHLIAALAVLGVALSGCNRSDNTGSGGGGAGGGNMAPTANAGSDFAVTEGDTATLLGTNSSDADGTITSYAWTQVGSPAVTISGANQDTASFVAPDVTEPTTLTFKLTVTDNDGATGEDTVDVLVNEPNIVDPGPQTTRNRYQFNNQCFAIQAKSNDKFLTASGNSFAAEADDASTAEAFFLKPSMLGTYMIYDRAKQLLNATGSLSKVSILDAGDSSVFTIKTVGDNTMYPPSPTPFAEPDPAELAEYRSFNDPNIEHDTFTIAASNGQNLVATGDSELALAAAADSDDQRFTLVPVESGCAQFPEAQSNYQGETFKGKTADNRVLGMADVHVHISATDFLGKSEWGSPFHKHGVMHALGENCEEYHGPNGVFSVTEAVYSQDFDGHDTTGWPSFNEWPARNNLFHEAIYWKWLERAWAAGLRVIVNDLVDNETLCELARNAAQDPTIDCNSMNNAGRQAGTMYAMQDYIDAQMGGRGEGWYQIVHDPDEGRAVIEKGQIAVVLGIEISNFLNCKVNYGAFPQKEPFEEDGAGFPVENSYSCETTETGADNEVLTQIQRIHGWGVRQVITIHEFDNAFGGNGIFGGLVLNLGNREDTGAIPSGALANPGIPNPEASNPIELPSGQFWTTYDCPEEGGQGVDGQPFSGYLWGNSGGDDLESLDPTCPYLGQGGRPGGPTPCYPAKNNLEPDMTTKKQCNARWLTPIGLYTYGKLMEAGMIFDIDHLELEMKTQALELAEAQNPPYPFVSTHGTFGGTSVDQAERILKNGGFLYPSLGNGASLIGRMTETRQIHAASGTSELFGFGFGTDTNGLSGQAGGPSATAIEYPYTLFAGAGFDALADFDGITGVVFEKPNNVDIDGTVSREWDINTDGSAHYGMLSSMVQEVRQDGTTEDLKDLFNSAERLLRTWTATLAARDGILNNANNGKVVIPASGVVRSAPTPPCELGRRLIDPSKLADPNCSPAP